MLPIKIAVPDGFLEEEVRSGYKVTSKMKRIWSVEIDMLMMVKDICDKYKIKWFVDGGTLIGAARHQGYVPWDDDIDIVMLREDFNKFCVLAEQDIKYPYFFQTQSTDEFCMHGHIQIRNCKTTAILKSESEHILKYNQGIFIDIFPLDNITDEIEEGRLHALELIKLKTTAQHYLNKSFRRIRLRKNLYLWFKYTIKNFRENMDDRCKAKYYYRKFLKGMEQYDEVATEYVTCYSLGYNDNKRWKRSWFDYPIYLNFEWFEVPVCCGYLEYLEQVYGDWRKYEKFTSNHGGIIFDTEKSYTEYLKLFKNNN